MRRLDFDHPIAFVQNSVRGHRILGFLFGIGPQRRGKLADFIDDESVQLFGFEAGGDGVETGRHASSINGGSVGVLHGTRTFLLQDAAGNVLPTHSISAGLDYPAVGPEHAFLREQGRARYESVSDDEALAAFHLLSRLEGIIPALESSHAIAWVVREAPALQGRRVLVNLSGRGDKDLGIIAAQEAQ